MTTKLLLLAALALSAAPAHANELGCDVGEGHGTQIICSKTTATGVQWSIWLADRDGDGEFAVCAKRGNEILYAETYDYPNRYLTLRAVGPGFGNLQSDRGTAWFSLNGQYGSFHTERYGYDVTNLECVIPL